MIEPVPFQPDRFHTAAAHYRTGRAPYPPALIARVAERIGLRPSHRVMDLGCGPGPLAVAFAPLVHDVIAIDPEPAMLAEARMAAAGLSNIRFVQGSSYDLGPSFDPVFLVTMGRSFHWMDRVDTLVRLDQLIEPGGAVALIHDARLDIPINGWRAAFDAVLARYEDPGTAWRGPDWVRHEAILLDSPFSRMETLGVIWRRDVPVDHLVDRALSLSSTSPARLGARATAMVAELRESFSRIAPSGTVTEVSEAKALIAWRP